MNFKIHHALLLSFAGFCCGVFIAAIIHYQATLSNPPYVEIGVQTPVKDTKADKKSSPFFKNGATNLLKGVFKW